MVYSTKMKSSNRIQILIEVMCSFRANTLWKSMNPHLPTAQIRFHSLLVSTCRMIFGEMFGAK